MRILRTIAMYSRVLGQHPQLVEVRAARCNLYVTAGDHAAAKADFEAAVQALPGDPSLANNLAWLLATSPQDELRDGARAVALATRACELTKHQVPALVGTLAAAHAESGDFKQALEWLGKWSMHDVLVLSLSIFFIKSQGVYDARSLNGVYFFTAAVLFMILAYAWLRTDVAAADPPAAKAGAAPLLPRKPQQPPSTMRNFAFSFLIILATVFFALGVMLPAIRFTTVDSCFSSDAKASGTRFASFSKLVSAALATPHGPSHHHA